MSGITNTHGTQGGRWLALWIAAAATAAIGVLLLYLGPNLLPGGKGFAPIPFLGQAPLALIWIGTVGMVIGAAGIARSRLRAAAASTHGQSAGQLTVAMGTTRRSDAAALAGFMLSAAAFVAVILIVIVWPVIASSMRAGPCDQNPTVACFQSHPDYYQGAGPGSDGYSTPVSRIGDNVVTPILLSAWPLGLAGALVGVVALVTGTRQRRLAILGVVLGTLTVAGMGAQYLAFLIGGGD